MDNPPKLASRTLSKSGQIQHRLSVPPHPLALSNTPDGANRTFAPFTHSYKWLTLGFSHAGVARLLISPLLWTAPTTPPTRPSPPPTGLHRPLGAFCLGPTHHHGNIVGCGHRRVSPFFFTRRCPRGHHRFPRGHSPMHGLCRPCRAATRSWALHRRGGDLGGLPTHRQHSLALWRKHHHESAHHQRFCRVVGA